MIYSTLYNTRNQKELHKVRLAIALSAKEHGIKSTARIFHISPNTVRKWLQRYKEKPKAMLYDRRPASVEHPNTMIPYYQLKLKEICETLQHYHQRCIASHIKREYAIPYSIKTIIKHLRKMGFFKTHKKQKAEKKQEARLWKQLLQFCQKIQVDIKYLTDIPELYFSLRKFCLPKYQITARDVATGALWICFATQKSSSHTALFIEYLLTHLASFHVDTSSITIQTDNGSEFISGAFSTKQSAFVTSLAAYEAHHTTIPYASPTYNSDVEASHKLIETECYAKMQNPTLSTFLLKSAEYQYSFNHQRHNSYKHGSPALLLKEKSPSLDPCVLTLRPLIVDTFLTKRTLHTWHNRNFAVY